MTRIEKSHAFELKGKRLERHRQFAIGQQRLQRRLQKIVQAVFQLDDILGRADARVFVALPAMTRNCACSTAFRRNCDSNGRFRTNRTVSRGIRALLFRKLRKLKTAHADRGLANGNLYCNGPETFDFDRNDLRRRLPFQRDSSP